MNQLDTWVKQMGLWYQSRKHDQGELLESLILSPPEQIWGPRITQQQSKAIACWLDGCLRIFERERYTSPNKAYQFLQLAYSKLQKVVTNSASELALKHWCMMQMQHLTVIGLEFCRQQTHSRWLETSHQWVDAHVQFMAAQSWNESRNNDQGSSTLCH
ncbi:transcriptional regulator [Vibrio sp. Isolate25]|uniref:transcriptional regulator n=1 Tax=Vibrio sp. Isolate25 TaxID=2908535 RepID=UPI001EFDC7B5|nr:transcriptional regulator [Vibrio sp. Isolate25]MCG9596385.1 transcriptional regulator [Vibrio sp. Isolate25]